jgi:hypothetical protein
MRTVAGSADGRPGRERNPSAQVIDTIGRALRLSFEARGHLYRLAGLNPGMAADGSRDLVHPALLQLLDAFPSAAAYVLSPAFDVLATNPVATALLSPFTGTPNMVRVLFRHPRHERSSSNGRRWRPPSRMR